METYKGKPVLYISINKESHIVDKISLVDFPAMEDNYLAFAKQFDEEDIESWFREDVEQKLAGAFIIPDKKILREDKDGNRFYVVFTKEVVAELASRYNRGLYGNKWNTQHSDDVDGVYVLENWIIEDTKFDKSRKYGSTAPAGTWFGIVKVDNTELWKKEIETNNLRGFSIEMVSGLKMALDAQIQDSTYESHVFDVLEGLGEKIPETWKEIVSLDLFDDEEKHTEESILNLAIQSNQNAPSSLDVNKGNVGQWRVRYRYEGVRDGSNRNFCARLLDFQGTDKVFRKEDIDQMSFTTSNPEFGTYSIFRYKGSYGCRHKWKRVIFFVDFEDDETRKVGNVPQVTSSINDAEAQTINANLNKYNKMSDKDKFAKIAELTLEERVVDAKVDDEDGDITVEGFIYTVKDGIITTIVEEKPAEDKPADDAPDAVSAEDMKKFMEATVAWMAGVDAKLEELSKPAETPEEFKQLKEGMDKLEVLLKLIPAKDDEGGEGESDVPTVLSALEQIKEAITIKD